MENKISPTLHSPAFIVLIVERYYSLEAEVDFQHNESDANLSDIYQRIKDMETKLQSVEAEKRELAIVMKAKNEELGMLFISSFICAYGMGRFVEGEVYGFAESHTKNRHHQSWFQYLHYFYLFVSLMRKGPRERAEKVDENAVERISKDEQQAKVEKVEEKVEEEKPEVKEEEKKEEVKHEEKAEEKEEDEEEKEDVEKEKEEHKEPEKEEVPENKFDSKRVKPLLLKTSDILLYFYSIAEFYSTILRPDAKLEISSNASLDAQFAQAFEYVSLIEVIELIVIILIIIR